MKEPLGREILLPDHVWYDHILQGHPELESLRPLVERTVEAPDVIF